ncbi:hypothetical protein ACQ76T_24820 [Chryseobacterium sp. JK1]
MKNIQKLSIKDLTLASRGIIILSFFGIWLSFHMKHSACSADSDTPLSLWIADIAHLPKSDFPLKNGGNFTLEK